MYGGKKYMKIFGRPSHNKCDARLEGNSNEHIRLLCMYVVQTRICYKLNIVNGKLTLNNNIHLIAHTHAIENSDTIRESFRMHAIVSIRNTQTTTTHDFDFDFHFNSIYIIYALRCSLRQ